jgi:hypothetical protein
VPLLRFAVEPARLIPASAAWPGATRRIPGASAWTVEAGRVRLFVIPIGVFLMTSDWSVSASSREVERLALDVSRPVTSHATPWTS